MIIYAFLYRFAIGQSPKLLVSPGSGFSPAELFLPWGEFFKGVFFFFFKGLLSEFFSFGVFLSTVFHPQPWCFHHPLGFLALPP